MPENGNVCQMIAVAARTSGWSISHSFQTNRKSVLGKQVLGFVCCVIAMHLISIEFLLSAPLLTDLKIGDRTSGFYETFPIDLTALIEIGDKALSDRELKNPTPEI